MKIKEIRNVKNIEIKKAIIHYIDPPRNDKKISEGFVSSEALLPLEDNSKLSNFIENHIINSISHKSSKIAKFKNINPNQVSGVCSNIINETIDFIEGSIFLGGKLFEVLLDNRTKETNLLVVLFSEKDNLSNNYLALLTIEPNDVYKNKVYYNEDKRVIGLDLIEDVITEKELYKCAFIQNLDEEKRFDDYDLIILEPQRKNISKFLLDKFLDAEESLDDKKRTEKFYISSVQAENFIFKNYGFDDFKYFRNQKDAALNQSEINYLDFINSLNFTDDQKNKIKEIFQSQLLDIEFNVDSDTKNKLTKFIKYEGDYDFQIKIEYNFFDQVIKSIDKKIVNGEEITEIIIQTKKWKEIK